MNSEKILHGIVLLGVFVLPFLVFVVMNDMFFPYITGKNFAFRIIVEIIFVAWVALAFMREEYRPRHSIIIGCFAVFVAIVALADFLGVNPIKSIWSNFERMEGLVTLVHMFAYTLVAASVFAREHVGLWFWRVSLGVATLVTFNTFIQFITTDKNRLDSTLGNPIYLAVYALFHIFIALILMFRRDASKGERIVYAVILPLQFWVLYMTATRGAILGVIGGLLLAAIGIAFTLRGENRLRIAAGAIIAVIVLSIGGFYLARESSLIQGSPVLSRFAGMSLTEGTVFSRTVIWSMAWEGVKERPLLGWGQENFNFVFNKYYDPRMYAQEPWFDRTHNVIFDWLIAAGILGLLSYISIFLALLWVIYKAAYFNVIQKWLLVGLLAAYSFHNLTVFDQLISYLLFFSLIAWIMATVRDGTENVVWFTKKEFSGNWMWLVGVVLISGALIFSINVQPIRANKLLLSALQDIQQANQIIASGADGAQSIANLYAQNALEKVLNARELDTLGRQEVNEHGLQTASRIITAEWASDELRTAWYQMGVSGMQAEEERADGDARFPLFVAGLHGIAGRLDEQKSALERALAISPSKQTLIIEVASNALRRGENEKTLQLLQQAYELEPAFKTAGVLYAIRLVDYGEMELFDTVFADNNYIGTEPQMLSLLIDRGEHTRAKRTWETAYRANLELKYAFFLASLYDKIGDTARTIQSVNYAVEVNPDLATDAASVLDSLGK